MTLTYHELVLIPENRPFGLLIECDNETGLTTALWDGRERWLVNDADAFKYLFHQSDELEQVIDAETAQELAVRLGTTLDAGVKLVGR
jgi:hypothetical protein